MLNTMATVKNNQNPKGASDMLNEFVAAEPTKGTRKSGPRAPFTPDPTVLAKITEALTSQGAIQGSKGYGSDKECRKAGATFKRYAEFAADGMGKTIAPRYEKRDSDGLFHWKFQLATKRVRKEPAEGETPAATA